MELLYTAITTPFTEDYQVDYNTLVIHMKILLNNNSGIVLFGTTGECPTLNISEKVAIIKYLDGFLTADDKAKFIIGVGGNNTKECMEMAELATHYNYTNIMVTTPYYNKPSQHGLYSHFKTIADYHLNICADSNVVLYNVPGRCVINLAPDTVKLLCKDCPNITAIKEASGNISQAITLKTLIPKLKVYSGDDALLVPMMSIGASGLISVISNIFPKQIHEILTHCKNSQFELAFCKYQKYHNFTELMFCESNPVPIKFALYYTKLYKTPFVRLPLEQLAETNKERIIKEMNSNIYDKTDSH